jgi:hypothetical protein
MTREWYRFFHDPTFASVNLVAPNNVASGGTGLASGTSGGVLGFVATTTLASSALLAKNGIVLGGGAGFTPTATATGTDGQLPVGQTSAPPAFKTLSGDATLSAAGALTIGAGAITYAKIQNVSAPNVLLGRKTAGAGATEEITPAGDLTLAGSTFTIGANAVTNAKLAQMATRTIKGNNTGGTANASDLSAGQFPATQTNDNASAGNAGEYISSTIATGASVALTNGVTANVTSISLTAGDWDVTGVVDFTFGATTSYTNLAGGVSTTSATLGAQDSFFDFETPAEVPTAANDPAWVVPTVRLSLSATTTVYLVAQAAFTVSTLKAYGTLRARRMR